MTVRLSASRKKVLQELGSGNRLIASGGNSPYFENFVFLTVTWPTFLDFLDGGLIAAVRNDLGDRDYGQRFVITEKGKERL